MIYKAAACPAKRPCGQRVQRSTIESGKLAGNRSRKCRATAPSGFAAELPLRQNRLQCHSILRLRHGQATRPRMPCFVAHLGIAPAPLLIWLQPLKPSDIQTVTRSRERDRLRITGPKIRSACVWVALSCPPPCAHPLQGLHDPNSMP